MKRDASYIAHTVGPLGRTGIPEILDREGFPYVSASDVPLTGRSRAPRPLTVDEIKEYSGIYAQAALNAVKAGFDGAEINGALGPSLGSVYSRRSEYTDR